MSSVHDVAAYIIGVEGNISTMKLQKLCYYAQGWHLAWHDEALFDEPIQAWRMGPVCPALYSKHKGKASVSSWPDGRDSELTPTQKKTIDIIVDFYRPYNGFDLGKRTHQERPWIEAYEHAGVFKGSMTITTGAIKSFFRELASRQA